MPSVTNMSFFIMISFVLLSLSTCGTQQLLADRNELKASP